MPSNHLSALHNAPLVGAKLQQELDLGRIAGPFASRPFCDFISSPLGLVPKKSPGHFRIIHDLSFPKQDSVNSHIPPGSSSVNYELLDDALAIVYLLGRGSLVAKADIESAFRLIPIHPASYHLTGFQWGGHFYYDKVLPFGASTSCRTFELFSSSLHWILKFHFQVSHLSHILDDFMFFGPPASPECSQSLAKFFILAEDIGVPVKQEKTVHPTTQLELHGILVDTVAWTISLPEDKLADAKQKLERIRKRRTVPLRELQSLLGTLSFATKVVAPGRAFLRRLYDLTLGFVNPFRHITLNSEARADLAAWRLFLDYFNGTHIFPDACWSTSAKIALHTAASPDGFAAILGTDWFRGAWPQCWMSYPQSIRDLYPFVSALRLWAPRLTNKKIVLRAPSQSVAHALNNSTSRLPAMMLLLRPLTVSNMRYNIQVHATYAQTPTSSAAVLLSQFQDAEARSAAPRLNTAPLRLPPTLQPWSKLPKN